METKKGGFTDDDVVRSVKKGNTGNFEIIVDRYKHRIINFIYRMTGDPDESRNIAQDVFLRIYRKIATYKENNTFESFIYTIARNTTLNHIKKMKRVTFFSSLPKKGEGENFPAAGETPAELLEREERDKLVVEGLKTLVENQRLALILKIYLGYSYKKIGALTGWSRPKIETLISRAKMKLKNYVILQEKGGSDV